MPELTDLLEKRPGYEAVYLLRQSGCTRQELIEYTGAEGGTLQRWLDLAQAMGVVEKDSKLQDGKPVIEYSLSTTVPEELEPVIEDRGGQGPRDGSSSFADVAGFSHWSDRHSV